MLPVSISVLSARVAAVLRRGRRKEPTPAAMKDVIQVGELLIHPGRHEILAGGHKIDASSTEFEILRYLATRPGWVYTRRQILRGVHGEDHPVLDRSIDVQIATLRRKLGDFGDMIETVRGVGYRFTDRSPADES